MRGLSHQGSCTAATTTAATAAEMLGPVPHKSRSPIGMQVVGWPAGSLFPHKQEAQATGEY